MGEGAQILQAVGFTPINIRAYYSDLGNLVSYSAGFRKSKSAILLVREGKYSIKLFLFGQASGSVDPQSIVNFDDGWRGAWHDTSGLFFAQKEFVGSSVADCVLSIKRFSSLYRKNLLSRFKDDIGWWIATEYPMEGGETIEVFQSLPEGYLSGNLPLPFKP